MSEAATKPDIVVGVDGSDESFAALKWALEEASSLSGSDPISQECVQPNTALTL